MTAAKPSSSPSQKIGTATAMSGECEAPRYGWLWMMTSPSSISPLEALEEAADVPGQRADVHRRRLRLAELAPLGVEDAGAEVLGLADDRAVAHAEEDAGHLLGDGVERAAEHAQGDRVDLDALAGGRAGQTPTSSRSAIVRTVLAPRVSAAVPAGVRCAPQIVAMTRLPNAVDRAR